MATQEEVWGISHCSIYWTLVLSGSAKNPILDWKHISLQKPYCLLPTLPLPLSYKFPVPKLVSFHKKREKKGHFSVLEFTQEKYPPTISAKLWAPAELPHGHTHVHTRIQCTQMGGYPCGIHEKLVLISSRGCRAGTLIHSYSQHCWKVEFTECPVWSLPPFPEDAEYVEMWREKKAGYSRRCNWPAVPGWEPEDQRKRRALSNEPHAFNFT